jgi:hypothetical protein
MQRRSRLLRRARMAKGGRGRLFIKWRCPRPSSPTTDGPIAILEAPTPTSTATLRNDRQTSTPTVCFAQITGDSSSVSRPGHIYRKADSKARPGFGPQPVRTEVRRQRTRLFGVCSRMRHPQPKKFCRTGQSCEQLNTSVILPKIFQLHLIILQGCIGLVAMIANNSLDLYLILI